ncbi:unnamed protein product [Lactuca saligna]|uniref:Uncharacterized protein n=1 Tax=Lactuca saligna TaxID=75948 RepID=A0AA35ZFR5_LACSI|nr:unnamed protein product [Lactuca saligna]
MLDLLTWMIDVVQLYFSLHLFLFSKPQSYMCLMKIQLLKPYLATAFATPSLAPLLRSVMTRNPNSLHNSNRHHQRRVVIDIYLTLRHKVGEEENFFAITTTSKPEETRILEELMMIYPPSLQNRIPRGGSVLRAFKAQADAITWLRQCNIQWRKCNASLLQK